MNKHKLENEDQDAASRKYGANGGDIDRLARIVTDMQHLEWQLAKRASKSDSTRAVVPSPERG